MKKIRETKLKTEIDSFDEKLTEGETICSDFLKTKGNENVLETIRRYLTPKKRNKTYLAKCLRP
jgi:hypothetical protein